MSPPTELQHIGDWSGDVRLALTHFIADYQTRADDDPRVFPYRRTAEEFMTLFSAYLSTRT